MGQQFVFEATYTTDLQQSVSRRYDSIDGPGRRSVQTETKHFVATDMSDAVSKAINNARPNMGLLSVQATSLITA